VDQQRRRREPARRRRDGGDAQGHAGPRRPAEMCRATFLLVDGEMREAAGSPSPPLRDLPRRVSSSPALSSLSLLYFGVSRGRLSQHPLDFAPDSRPPFVSRSISRRPLDFPLYQDGARLILHGVQRTPLDAQADALPLRQMPYASRQGDGDAYHLEGAWMPSRHLGDALRTLLTTGLRKRADGGKPARAVEEGGREPMPGLGRRRWAAAGWAVAAQAS